MNVKFTMKDFYNKNDSERQAFLADGDAEAALGYTNAKAATDPEYACFGDILERLNIPGKLCLLRRYFGI